MSGSLRRWRGRPGANPVSGRLAYAIAIERSPEQQGFCFLRVSFLRSLGHTVAAQIETIRAEREKTERAQRRPGCGTRL